MIIMITSIILTTKSYYFKSIRATRRRAPPPRRRPAALAWSSPGPAPREGIRGELSQGHSHSISPTLLKATTGFTKWGNIFLLST